MNATTSSTPSSGTLPFPTEPLPRVSRPSPREFERDYLVPRRPVVVTGVVSEWPALRRWTDAYLLDKLGSARCALSLPTQGLFCDVERGRVEHRYGPYAGVARRLLSDEPADRGGIYIMNQALTGPFAALGADVAWPPYVPDDVRRGAQSWCHLWIGPAGTLTPAHYDGAHTLFAQLRGTKRFWLIAPEHYERLYPVGIGSDMPHNSRIGDLERADVRRFPRLAEVRAYEVDVAPGELLFIPTFWWHQVRSLTSSISVNFWWRPPARTFASRPGMHVLGSAWYRGARDVGRRLRGLLGRSARP